MSHQKRRFSEEHLVEDYIIEKLVEKGWDFVPPLELERESFEEPLLIPNLLRALERINKNLGLGEEEKKKVLNELSLTPTGIEGSKKILKFYKHGVPVKFEKERIVQYVGLFDFEDIENNKFIVSQQVNYQGKDRIRVDIILYINGIPVVVIECKNPTDPSVSWYNAYRQIKDYENTVPELFKYVQIGVAAELIAKYFPIVPWQEEVFTYEWKEENKDSIDSMLEMLSPLILLDILKNFLFFKEQYGNATKVITRYMQYRAANKIVNRVLKNLRGEEDKEKGLVWHWQGSGKTLTMIFAAHKLYYSKELSNPTIFFIVDRIDLQNQLSKEFNSLDMFKPEVIPSIYSLRETLAHDNYRGKRGVLITLIHKFSPEELNGLQKELEDLSQESETVMTRRNIIAFIDEGHRSQYGLLAAQMKNILKNAFFFAFTGTPIAKKGRDTYVEFSYPPEEPYLDRYFITDSIRDGFTVKIVYQPRLEELHLRKDLLEAFLELEVEELPEKDRVYVEERVRRRIDSIRLFLENESRVQKIVEDIAEHFKENVEGKFKAMIVTGSRKACVIYKRELDKILPPEYSEVVMTYNVTDTHPISDFMREQVSRYEGKDIGDIRKDIVEKFKEEEFPKILIVTDMLLTGFDAPILQTMYLDKPLKEHRLLQAVARTNRPYKDLKEAGVIIDYVGVLKNLKRALQIYLEEDIKGALYDYESLKEDFINLIKEVNEILKEVPKNYERDSLLKAIEILTSDSEKEKDFVEKYKSLRRVFELLGPNEVKLDYLEDYKWISAIYTYYNKVVLRETKRSVYVQRYYEKTLKYIYKSTEINKIDRELPPIEFDEEYLKKLEEKVKDKKEKAANILFTLNRFVLVERHRNPVYESLVDRVERLVKLWKEKTKEYELLYKEGVKIIEEINRRRERQKKLNFNDLEYDILLKLENRFGPKEELTQEVKNLTRNLKKYMFPGWISQITVKKDIERELRRFARKLKVTYGLTMAEMEKLHKQLLDSVWNYGA